MEGSLRLEESHSLCVWELTLSKVHEWDRRQRGTESKLSGPGVQPQVSAYSSLVLFKLLPLLTGNMYQTPGTCLPYDVLSQW